LAAASISTVIGANGYIVTLSGGGDYAMGYFDYLVEADLSGGSLNISLPDARKVGNQIFSVIRSVSALNTLTVNTVLSQTINGGATAVVAGVLFSVGMFISNGTNWRRLVSVETNMTEDSRPLTADGPIIQKIISTLENQNSTLAIIQAEAKDNTKTLQAMQLSSVEAMTKITQLVEFQKQTQGVTERLAVTESRMAGLESRIEGVTTTIRWSVGIAVSAFTASIGLVLAFYAQVHK